MTTNAFSPHQNSCHENLSFGCPVLDKNFCGGLRCRGITEIVSESGAGKTQLTLQMLLSAQMPHTEGGLQGSSIYLYTQNPFPSRRLHQLANHKDGLPEKGMDRVFVQYIRDVEHLIDVLLRVEIFIQTNNIKILAIDSMAGLFRGVFDNTPKGLAVRKKYFYKIAALLKTLSHKYGMAVLVTNQVSDVIESEYRFAMEVQDSFITSGRKVKPALGPIWGKCVDSRLSLQIHTTEQSKDFTTTNITPTKMMHVLFSSYIPRGARCQFAITSEKFAGVEQC